MDVNELLVSAYLEHVKACDVVDVHETLGETRKSVDVLGVNTRQWRVYACLVENHVWHAEGSVGSASASAIARSVAQCRQMIAHVDRQYEGFEAEFMFWMPAITDGSLNIEKRPSDLLNEIVTLVQLECGVTLKTIANEQYLFRMKQLRHAIGSSQKIFKDPVLRFIQMEERLLNAYSADQAKAELESTSQVQDDVLPSIVTRFP